VELSKHKNHRNAAYLAWLRKQKGVVSGKKAECAHHIRLGTNGGSSLKPSDYFCIPLLNEFHTSGLFAIHGIGEGTFLELFKLDEKKLFIDFLSRFLKEKHKTDVEIKSDDDNYVIAALIRLIEEVTTKKDRASKPKNKKSITENEFYQKSMEDKRIRDKELRAQLKEEAKLNPIENTSPTFKGNEFYEKAKELKRIQDRDLRAQMKSTAKKPKKSSTLKSDYYEKAKEYKRQRDKELRAELKLKQKATPSVKSTSQTEYYEKAKELKRARDKEFRQRLKEQRKKASQPAETQSGL
jgi:hypothetical protein